MAIKVIAQRREVKLGKNPGMKFVRRPDLYIPIQEKKVFAEASIQITCLDEEGNMLKRVTSSDSGEVEDNENAGNENNENSENSENGGSQNSGEQNSAHGLPDGHHDHELHGTRTN